MNKTNCIDLNKTKRTLQDVYIYGENSVTLLGADSKTNSNTYLIQLNLQPTPTGVSNDLIEVTSYSENVNNNGDSKSTTAKSPRETNLLMIKAEKLSANSIVKCIRKLKSSSLCVSSSRKVAALLAASKNRVKIFELEVDEEDDEVMDENDNDSVADNEESLNGNDANQTKNFNNSYQASETDEFNMPSNKPLLGNENSNKSNGSFKQFAKHQSAGSTCSTANSLCSSTAATVGSVSTITNFDSSSSTSRVKRKKNFDYDEDEDDESEDNLLNENNNEMNNFINQLKQNSSTNNNNLLEITSNQNGNQGMNLQRDNQPETI